MKKTLFTAFVVMLAVSLGFATGLKSVRQWNAEVPDNRMDIDSNGFVSINTGLKIDGVLIETAQSETVVNASSDTTITATQSLLSINANSTTITFTSIPMFTAGTDKQRLRVYCSSNNITMSDNDTLAGSLLELTEGTALTLSLGEWVDFVSNGTSWLQDGFAKTLDGNQATIGNVAVGGTLGVTGIATFTGSPVVTYGLSAGTIALGGDIIDEFAGTNLTVTSGDLNVDPTSTFAGTITVSGLTSGGETISDFAGTNLSVTTGQLNVGDAFLVNDEDDTTSGVLTATNGFSTTYGYGGSTIILTGAATVASVTTSGDVDVNGALLETVTTLTITEFTAVTLDEVLLTTAQVGYVIVQATQAVTLRLPAAAVGLHYTIVRDSTTAAAVASITVDPDASETIGDGSSTSNNDTDNYYDILQIFSDDDEWFISNQINN